jgi:hypothetical protein
LIICNLNGGLGNQMFQYAFAKSLSIETNQVLKFSIDDINSDQQRNFELLEVFGIHCDLASHKEQLIASKYLTFFNFTKKLSYVISKYVNINFFLITDNNKKLPDIIQIVRQKKQSYLLGYWQDFSFFDFNRDSILEWFTFRLNLNSYYSKILFQIEQTNSVSIHVRRGDYVTNRKALKFHGLIDIDYYKKSVNFMFTRYTDVHFFIFSDDVNFVTNEFTFLNENVTIVDSRKSNHNASDLMLMSKCKHNIIANSSFSWWGAWLNNNQGKIVVAPKNWFINQDHNHNRLIPNTWISI